MKPISATALLIFLQFFSYNLLVNCSPFPQRPEPEAETEQAVTVGNNEDDENDSDEELAAVLANRLGIPKNASNQEIVEGAIGFFAHVQNYKTVKFL